jgi:transcriptional regulator with XRE-family HTH domain
MGDGKMKQAKALPFNKALKTVRKRLKLTLEEFGRKAGVSASLIYSYESGRREPSDEVIGDIKKALIQAIADAARKEREEKLLAFKAVSDGVAVSAPDLSTALQQYCFGSEVTAQQKDSRQIAKAN